MIAPAPNARDQAMGWALSFCTDWEECRDDAYFAPEKAWALLAAWGTLCRFFPELPDAVASVKEVTRQDAAALLAALQQAPGPAQWLERARDLDRAWDFARREHELRELEIGAIELFDRLDRHSLALCMAWRLNPGKEVAALDTWASQLSQGEDFFCEHVDSFLSASPLASAVISNCRPDLEDADPELWLTTLKHRCLEQVSQETEAIDRPPGLTEIDKQAIQAKVDRFIRAANKLEPLHPPETARHLVEVEPAREPSTTRDTRAEYAMAAIATEDDPALLDRLAQDAPPANMHDYRRAWAHFLACCYRGTPGGAIWREVFLKATARVESLSNDWQQRVQRVQDLSTDYDWKRHYMGRSVFSLELQPLNTEEELVRWLEELTSSSSSN